MRKARLVSIVAMSLGICAQVAMAGFSGRDLFLPSVGFEPGVAPVVGYTTVYVHNPNGTPANITFYLLERLPNLAPMTFTDTIQPGGTAKYENAVQLMFGKQTLGTLRLTSNVRVMAGSRVSAQSGPLDDSVGQYLAGTPASFAIGAGQSTELVGACTTRAAADSAVGYTYGFVETTGTGTCEVKVRVKDPTGAELGSTTSTVGQWEHVQRWISGEFPGLSSHNARLTVEVTAGTGRIIAFGSSVANGLLDPARFETAFRDELLAENASDRHATAVTAGAGISVEANTVSIAEDGVSSSRIADGTIATEDLADQAVTLTKLSPGGGSKGKVLKHTGSAVEWADDLMAELTLPYLGVLASLNDVAFKVINTGYAIVGEASDATAAGVTGRFVTNDNEGMLGIWNAGVYGHSEDAVGVYGYSEEAYGVRGSSIDGTGVYGYSMYGRGVMALGGGAGIGLAAVHATNGTVNGVAVAGIADRGNGVVGTSTATGYAAVFGKNLNGYGLYGESTSAAYSAVYGKSTAGIGMRALSSSGTGIWGQSASADGVLGRNTGHSTTGVLGAPGAGVWADKGTSSYAGWFEGNVYIHGNLAATGTKPFRIDHPLDPEHKVLYHFAIESPEVLNVYQGNVVTDAEGRAVVELPAYFEALNRDFRYQLTVIGRFAQAIVEEEIRHNRFVIRTNLASVKVSWQVTGIRNDPSVRYHAPAVEEDKPEAEQGLYLDPAAHGLPEERGVARRNRPEVEVPPQDLRESGGPEPR